MAFTFSCNNTPANGSEAQLLVKTTMKSAGWTVPSSSDGSTYNSSGDQISQSGSGAGGMANNFAWYRIRMPGSTKEFIFQRGNSGNSNWRVKYSQGNGFSGGSPSATQTPSATDEIVIIGGGTDAAPTFGTLWAGDGTYRLHMAIGGLAEDYAFWVLQMTRNLITSNAIGIFGMDRMVSGSYPAADTDPSVIFNVQSSSNIGGNLRDNGAGTVSKGYLGAIATANFVQVTMQTYGSTTFPPSGSNNSQSPFTRKDYLLPMFWYRPGSQAAPNGYKGVSRLFLTPSVARADMTTMTVSTTRDKLVYGSLVLDWNGSNPLL